MATTAARRCTTSDDPTRRRDPVSLPALAGAGLVIGYIAGMFGVGGGFLLTPLLMYGFGVPAPIAVGSALSQKCGTSLASFIKYRHLGLASRASTSSCSAAA